MTNAWGNGVEGIKMKTFWIANFNNLGQQLGLWINSTMDVKNLMLRYMLKIYLGFWKCKPYYAYKHNAYIKTCILMKCTKYEYLHLQNVCLDWLKDSTSTCKM